MSESERMGSVNDRLRLVLLEVTNLLVGDAEPVSIEFREGGDSFSTISIRASPAALSILIGANGQTARALRTLLAGVGARGKQRYALDLSPGT